MPLVRPADVVPLHAGVFEYDPEVVIVGQQSGVAIDAGGRGQASDLFPFARSRSLAKVHVVVVLEIAMPRDRDATVAVGGNARSVVRRTVRTYAFVLGDKPIAERCRVDLTFGVGIALPSHEQRPGMPCRGGLDLTLGSGGDANRLGRAIRTGADRVNVPIPFDFASEHEMCAGLSGYRIQVQQVGACAAQRHPFVLLEEAVSLMRIPSDYQGVRIISVAYPSHEDVARRCHRESRLVVEALVRLDRRNPRRRHWVWRARRCVLWFNRCRKIGGF